MEYIVAAAALAKHGLYVCIKRGLFGIPTQWRTVGERVWNLACWWWCSRRSPRMRSLVFEAAEFWDKVHRKYIDTYCTGLPKVNFGFLKTCILDFRQYTKALMYLVTRKRKLRTPQSSVILV